MLYFSHANKRHIYATPFTKKIFCVIALLNEPRHEKTCLRGVPRDDLVCSASGARLRLDIADIETRGIILSRQRTTKVLIRLRGCTG